MYPSVIGVVPGANYVLTVLFDNGESGVLDMKPVLDFGIFKRIKNYDSFKQVRVAFDTIEWDCGVDLDPEYVYARCKESKGSVETFDAVMGKVKNRPSLPGDEL